MKRILLLAALASTSLFSIAQAQEVFDPSGESEHSGGPKIIRMYAEYYEITTLEYAEIMSNTHTGTDDTKFRAKLLQMAKDGKAKLIDSQTVNSRSGEKATTEAITEYIYPTEYDFTPTGKEKMSEDTDKSKVLTSFLPTAFETRNLGSTLEVEPTLGDDNKTIDVRFAPEIVYHIGESNWGESFDSKVKMTMPTFYTYRINTAVTLINGQFQMIGSYTPKDDKNKADPSKKLLIFVKAEILNLGR